MAGGLNPKTGHVVWVVGKTRNADLFLAFLGRVRKAYPRSKKIHLIVDRCKAHTCLRERFEHLPSRLDQVGIDPRIHSLYGLKLDLRFR